jgi:hypothetical protein
MILSADVKMHNFFQHIIPTEIWGFNGDEDVGYGLQDCNTT